MTEIQFLHPTSVHEAVAMLADHAGSRCLAGGQTLVAMMNAGLLEVPALVSLAGIEGLAHIAINEGGGVRIGAAARHCDIALHDALTGGNFVVREAAAKIAHPAIRNFGTIGGSLAHADPAADFPTAVIAAGAAVEIVGAQGVRTVMAEDFFVDYLTTALQPGEMITAVLAPAAPPDSVGRYLKFSRVDGDFAIVSVGVTLSITDGVCTAARLALGGCGPIPTFSPDANLALIGSDCGDAAVAKAARHLIERTDPVDDVRASASYRRAVIPNLVRRAVREAKSQIVGGEKA